MRTEPNDIAMRNRYFSTSSNGGGILILVGRYGHTEQ